MDNQNLWAPWRWDYIKQLDPGAEASRSKPVEASNKKCFLCEAAQTDPCSQEARQQLVLQRDDRGILMLNKYPYANGHLLIAPHDHRASLADLSSDQRAGLMELTALGQRLLTEAIHPQGMNIGINIGRCAGAGLPGHLHVHIVPRWSGDTNFMHVVGQIRVVPQALEQSHTHLAQTLAQLVDA